MTATTVTPRTSFADSAREEPSRATGSANPLRLRVMDALASAGTAIALVQSHEAPHSINELQPQLGQHHMKHLKIWRSLLLALATIGVGGCGIDSPTAPKLQNDASTGLVSDLVGGLLTKDALTRKTALTSDITVSAVIGKAGGRLAIPAAGFELTVPAGAVTSNTVFTVTAVRGSLTAYEFGPHGLKFRVPLKARQDLSGTNWRPINLKPLVAGYFLERSDLDQNNAKALLSELIQGLTIPLSKQFTWQIDHFSGYVVAW